MRIARIIVLVALSSLLFSCGEDGSFYAPLVNGKKTFIANGGASDGLFGGNGGSILMEVFGDVKVSKAGTVDTGFSIPTHAYQFGSNKATVSADTTVLLDPEAQPAAGVLYLVSGQPYLFVSNGVTGAAVSGLEVKPGATLILPANDGSWARANFSQSVVIDGTIKTAVDGDDLAIEAGSLFQIGARGLVTTRSSTIGTDSGDIYLSSQSVFINTGTIDSSGVDSSFSSGGNAGSIEINAESFVYNTGSLLSVGGNGPGPGVGGNGGNGGWMGIYSFFASVSISGVLDCSGGDGDFGGHAGVYHAGEGEYESGGIDISAGSGEEAGSVGHVLTGGTITANGGNGSSYGYGGDAGYVSLEGRGGKLWTSAAVTARGGSVGGRGGDFRLFADYGMVNDYSVETWGIKITGDIDLSGGDYGGYGGNLEIRNNVSGAGSPTFPAVEMLGYKSISMNGGSAEIGGEGGQYRIVTHDWYSNQGVALPVGSISNSVPASLTGGSASSASGVGGLGGSLRFVTANNFGHDGQVVVENSADIDISGGIGNSRPNYVLFYGYNKVVNKGMITAHSGPGVVHVVTLLSSYDVLNSGAIDASGAFGNLQGGDGGIIDMFAGNQVKNKAAITSNGGDSDTLGGNGGWISIISEHIPTSNSGVLQASGGKGGTTDGMAGHVNIDFVDVL